jgi:hypothetical protein
VGSASPATALAPASAVAESYMGDAADLGLAI